MSKADELRAKRDAITRQRETSDNRPSKPAAPRRRVRRTVDLSPMHHASLSQWCAETAVHIGAARVTGQDVLGALVARLLTDETVAKKIRADLRERADDQ